MFRQIVSDLFEPGRDGDGGSDYRCRRCGSGFGRRRQVCPDCGGYRVERSEW